MKFIKTENHLIITILIKKYWVNNYYKSKKIKEMAQVMIIK